MKIIEEANPIEMENVGDTINFTMKSNPKAFKILADSLYSDKITAIIRELSTNAYDSHVEAGCPDKPFDVYLPSWNNNNFYIRDYGVGLTDQQIEKIYSTFFESTKTDTNEAVGCLGLGSKTPFSYNTKTFTVTSWKDGKKWVYSCFYKDGIPSMSKLLEEDSNEPSGLKVEFSVAKDDDYHFEIKAKNIYKFFDTTPNFVNKKIVVEKPSNFTIDHPEFKYSKDLNRSYLVMGQIAYPITNISDFTPDESQVIDSGFLFTCDIGHVDMTPSREQLEYNAKTLRRIKAKIKHVLDYFTNDIQNQIDKEKTVYEALCKQNELGESLRFSFVNWNDLTYNGKKLANITSNNSFRCKRFSSSGLAKGMSATIRFNSNDKFYINDSSYALQRMSTMRYTIPRESHCYYFTDKDSFDQVNKHLDIPSDKIFYTSSLPKPNIVSVKRGSLSTVSQYVNKDYRNVTNYWSTTKIDFNDTSISGVIATKHRYNFVFHGKEYTPQEVYKLLSILSKNCGVTIPNIYAVRKADTKKVPKTWKSFEEWFDATMKSKKATDFYCNLKKAEMYHAYKSQAKFYLCSSKALNRLNLKKFNDFRDNLSEYEKIATSIDSGSYYNTITNGHFKDFLSYIDTKSVKCDVFDLVKRYKEFTKKYPLITNINHDALTMLTSEVQKYINATK